MQKGTKDTFLKLKALRPIINSISYYYGIDWKADRLIERWWLEYTNKSFPFNTEKELVEEMKRLIESTENDLGLRLPHTVKKLKL